jgi:hypothetical protein
LQGMCNLKRLESEDGYFPDDVGTEIVDRLSSLPFQLEHLTWPSDDRLLSAFIWNQPQLKSLKITASWSIRYDPGALPALSSLSKLSTTVPGIQSLLPGRKITSLHWIPDLYDPVDEIDDLHQLTSSLRQLKTLVFGGSFTRPPLWIISTYLDNITVLHLITLRNVVCFSLSNSAYKGDAHSRRRRKRKGQWQSFPNSST